MSVSTKRTNVPTQLLLDHGGDEIQGDAEEQPRKILDLDGSFTLADGLRNLPTTFMLHPEKGTDLSSAILVQPVPANEAVKRTRARMGNGECGIWSGTHFHPWSSADSALSPTRAIAAPPREFFKSFPINTSVVGLYRWRYCIRRRFAPKVCSMKTMCIFADGACPDVGRPNAKGGCGFVYGAGATSTVSFSLENRGPDGKVYPATSIRAELRAIIGALEFRPWWAEGWERVVLIVDNEMLSYGATGWLRNWAGKEKWKMADGRPRPDRDLWEKLSAVMGTYADKACEISFFLVPRDMNWAADRAALAAVEKGAVVDQYTSQFDRTACWAFSYK
jgi:ribonuclease HI